MPNWRLHDLRRTVATGLNDLGVAPIVADRILNHVPKKQKGQVMFVYNRAEYVRERRDALTLWEHMWQSWQCPSRRLRGRRHQPPAIAHRSFPVLQNKDC